MKTRIKKSRLISTVICCGIFIIGLFGNSAVAQDEAEGSNTSPQIYELFDERIPHGAQWIESLEDSGLRGGGFAGDSYLYLRRSDREIGYEGLNIPIRENPAAGEYRYLSFAWIKWGGGSVALELTTDASVQNGGAARYVAGDGDALADTSLRILDEPPHPWVEVTRDLWRDFGDVTITGIRFISYEGRDAGLDRVYLAQQIDDFAMLPIPNRMRDDGGQAQVMPAPVAPIEPSRIAESTPVQTPRRQTPAASGGQAQADASSGASVSIDPETQSQDITINWGQQLLAGGWTMIALAALLLGGIVITVQRFLTSKLERIAPIALARKVHEDVGRHDYTSALKRCERNPSTLANAFSFVLRHRNGDVQVVSEAAGDIAGRDIREHLNRIYPLSIIASLAPLLGLLGTIIGMIEAFELVSIYGDEGGASLLAGSISKALITTAAGLIIAIPAIGVYFVLKNRIMRIASQMETELESLIASIYLDTDRQGASKSPTNGQEIPQQYKSPGRHPSIATPNEATGEPQSGFPEPEASVK